MMQMALSNAVHPEYGVVTISFPIPEEEYGHCLELLEALEIGNAVNRDCKVQEVQDGPPILKRLEGSRVNLDELDYLAKRLDSFTDPEQGNQYAQYALGKLFLIGKEVPQDPEAAVRWFALSAAQGNEYAQYFLDHMDEGLSILSCATRLLHHLSGIFQEQASRGPIRTVTFTDRKLRQRIREKKMAMGHKPDDHEDAEISMR